MTPNSGPPMVASIAGEMDDGVFFFYVTADQLVRLADVDDFADARPSPR